MKRKVAFFVISTHLGGAERSLLDYLKNCDRTTMDVVVVTPKSSGPLIDELKKINISTEVLELPLWLLEVSRKKKLEMVLKRH